MFGFKNILICYYQHTMPRTSTAQDTQPSAILFRDPTLEDFFSPKGVISLYQITKIVMNSGSQLSVLQSVSQMSQVPLIAP